MSPEDEKNTHEDCLAELHHAYHRYKLSYHGHSRQPLEYTEWLEHKAVLLADKLGSFDEKLEQLEAERDRYQHAANCNHELWVEATAQKNALYGLLAAARTYSLNGNLKEISRLLLHWASWN